MRMAKLFWGGVAVVLAGLGLESVAHAQQAVSGFTVNKFEPAERGSDWFYLDSLDLRGATRPALGATLQYNLRPLVTSNPDGSAQNAVVKNQLTLHLGGAVVLGDRIRFGFDLPVQIFADGDDGVEKNRSYKAPANTLSQGDLRLGIDMRLFNDYGDKITMGIGAQIAFPTGDRTNYTSDGIPRFMPHVAAAGDIGMIAYAARLGFTTRDNNKSQTWAGLIIGPEVNVAASVGLRLLDKKVLIGPEFYASTGVTNGDTFLAKSTTPMEIILGLHWLSPSGFRVGGGIGPGLTRGAGSPDVRVIASIEYATPWTPPEPELPKVLDRDGDGINDDEDACPLVAGVRTTDKKTNGCPVPKPADKDGDGIIDSEDACVDVAGVRSDDPKKNGCPSDKDEDGIIDAEDACIDVPGVKSDDPKKNGCPPDRDGDGIPDAVDACPDVPGVASTNPKFNGCPADKDGDGVLNDVDACPDEPGAPDPDPTRNGCPKAFVQNGQIKILDQVKFKTGSAEIQPGKDSEEVLQAVAKVIAAHPDIKKLRIEGHTDDKGSAALNKKLSADRAASVVKWLVKNGVPAAMLTSQGFGPERPLVPNKDEDGRRQNRRVEFHIDDGTLPPPPPPAPPVAPPPTAKPAATTATTPAATPAKPATPATTPPAKPAATPAKPATPATTPAKSATTPATPPHI